MTKKVQIMFAGIGLFVLLSHFTEVIFFAFSYPLLYYFGISRAERWYVVLENILPWLAYFPAGFYIGYKIRRQGGLFSAMVGGVYAGLVSFGFADFYFDPPLITGVQRAVAEKDWWSLKWFLIMKFGGPVINGIIAVTLMGAGGWLGEWWAGNKLEPPG